MSMLVAALLHAGLSDDMEELRQQSLGKALQNKASDRHVGSAACAGQ